MLVSRPEKPQGRHVLLLREHLGINQTQFGALVELNQPAVSSWESPHRREEFLEAGLAKRFLEVWDLFPTPPEGGYTEMMAVVSAYRRGNTAIPEPTGSVTERVSEASRTWPIILAQGPLAPGTQLVETGPLVPVGGSAKLTRMFAAIERKAPPAESEGQGTAAPEDDGANPEAAPGSRAAPMRRVRFEQWAIAASVLTLLIPTGCFRAHESLRGQPAGVSAEREPFQVPGQVYTENAKKAEGEGAPKQSIKMPDKPYSWQKVAPCDPNGEKEEIGGCWLLPENVYPPCPEYTVENKQGKCLLPIPAKPKPSTSVTSGK